jgi:hypothetical protein
MSLKQTRHTGGLNPPGYVCPKRKGRKVLAIHVTPEFAIDVREALDSDKLTLQEKGEELFKNYVRNFRERSHNQYSAPHLNDNGRRPNHEVVEDLIVAREIALLQATSLDERQRVKRDLVFLRKQAAYADDGQMFTDGERMFQRHAGFRLMRT